MSTPQSDRALQQREMDWKEATRTDAEEMPCSCLDKKSLSPALELKHSSL
jgi:hypothetical protein